MRVLVRAVIMLAFPLSYGVCFVITDIYARRHPRWNASLGTGALLLLLLPTVVIYLLGLAVLFRRLRPFRSLDLLVFALGTPLVSIVMMRAVMVASYRLGNSHVGDFIFFLVLPFAPPALAVYGAYRGALALHQRRLNNASGRDV